MISPYFYFIFIIFYISYLAVMNVKLQDFRFNNHKLYWSSQVYWSSPNHIPNYLEP